jgi:uncharacterized membrane protein
MKVRSPLSRVCARPVRLVSRLMSCALLVGFVPTCAGSAIQFIPGLSVGDHTLARGVTADASVVVGRAYVPASQVELAFRWTRANGIQYLGTLPGDHNSRAYDVSADGSVVVGESIGFHAFRWTEAGGMQSLGPLSAYGVSGDGAVAVGVTTAASGAQAVRWTGSTPQLLGVLSGGSTSLARSTSTDGSVVVGGSGGRAFRWTAATGMQPLGAAEEAEDVSSDGSAIVGFTTVGSAERGFRWTQSGGTQLLAPLAGSTRSDAYSISPDGRIVVGESGGNGNIATIWDAENGHAINLQALLAAEGVNLSGWVLNQAFGISGDSTSGYNIVGVAFDPNPNGRPDEAFLVGGLFAVPEPTAPAIALAIAAAHLLARRRRHS